MADYKETEHNSMMMMMIGAGERRCDVMMHSQSADCAASEYIVVPINPDDVRGKKPNDRGERSTRWASDRDGARSPM